MKPDSTDLLRETKAHGSSDYPIEYYINDIPETYRHMRAHWHHEFEITLVTKGSLLYIIGEQSYVVSEGSLLLIGPETLHSAQQIDNKTARTTTIVFSLQMLGLNEDYRSSIKYLRPFADRLYVPLPVLNPNHAYYKEMLSCFEEIWRHRLLLPGSELIVTSSLFRMMYYVWVTSPKDSYDRLPDVSLRNVDKLKPVITYIHTHYMEALRIEDLADMSGFSQVHFMNIFKKYLKIPCMEYIISYRIALAAEALRNTDTPIMKIALDHGFQNISYFNRKFKEQVGCTPSQYRKKGPAAAR